MCTTVQPDQIIVAVLFWYIVKKWRYYTVAYTTQVVFCEVLETHGHVYLVPLYLQLLNQLRPHPSLFKIEKLSDIIKLKTNIIKY